MKKFLFMMILAASLVACSKNTDSSVREQEVSDRVPVTVEIASSVASRAVIDEDLAGNEAKVNSLQILVFRDGALDAYGKDLGVSKVVVSCTMGAREVWAVVNAPDLSNISSVEQLMAAKTYFKDNALMSFVMIGKKSVSITGAATVTIDVNRIASRLVVRKITNNLSSAALRELEFRVDSIFVINVQGANNYGGNGYQAVDGIWHNRMMFDAADADMPKALVLSETDEKIAYGSSSANGYAVYAYPNDYVASEDEQSYDTWTKRSTRLVVKANIGGRGYYYPITMPVMESNKSYEVKNLIITRPGSDNPDKPVTSFDVQFEINVLDWTQVLVTGDNDTPGSGDYTI